MIPLVMGVLNVTPDSFSDGGRYLDVDDAVARAREMVAEGADVVDVGGESTRPGATPVTPEVELSRVMPVIEALSGTVRLSIDTRHAEVARAAVAAGASIVNDVSAGLWQVAADTGAGWIAMHMSGEPASMQDRPSYGDVVGEVRDFLLERAATGVDAGVNEIWIDPGIGFGKSYRHNIELLARVDEFVGHRLGDLDLGVAIGTSRKSLLGRLTARSDARVGLGSNATGEPVDADAAPIDQRLAAGLATATWAMSRGVGLIRTHDVRAHRHAALVVAGEIAPAEEIAA